MSTDPSGTSDTGGQTDPDPTSNDSDGQDHKSEAEKWKALARKHEQQAKANAAAAKKLAELEDASKTEVQKLTEELETLRADKATSGLAALRLEVALEKAPAGMAADKIAKLAKRLTGTSRDELEADADELFADFPTAAAGGQQPAGQGRPSDGRPKPQNRKVPVPDTANTDATADMNEWLRSQARR